MNLSINQINNNTFDRSFVSDTRVLYVHAFTYLSSK